jgi:hypothetical protein
MSRDLQKQAEEQSDGLFTVKTVGLREQRHADLEVVGVPRPAVEAAAKLLDYVVEVVIDRGNSELKAGQNVGVPLSIEGHEDVEPVFVGVHAKQVEQGGGGFFAKMLGKSKRVLRLVDLHEQEGTTPLTALATVMLYRANCRHVTGDTAGAIAELSDSVAMFPGDPDAGPPPPETDVDGGQLNWQNHLSYLRMADLHENEADQAAAFEAAMVRFPWLAERMLGATIAELANIDPSELTTRASHILAHNLGSAGVAPGPHEGLRMVASPVWTKGDGAQSVRIASLIPAPMVDYYFGQTLADEQAAAVATQMAASSLAKWHRNPSKLAELTFNARSTYLGEDPTLQPVAEAVGARHPADGPLSALLAEVARCLYAGTTTAEVEAVLEVEPNEELAALASEKLAALEDKETELFMSAITG